MWPFNKSVETPDEMKNRKFREQVSFGGENLRRTRLFDVAWVVHGSGPKAVLKTYFWDGENWHEHRGK
jgi:hypothetical protein